MTASIWPTNMTNPTRKSESAPTKAKGKTKNFCWCGCGGLTNGKFVPGHDARFHSLAKQVARGLVDENDLPPVPCQEAADDFQMWVDRERPIWAAKQAALAKEKAAKAAAKKKVETVVETDEEETEESAEVTETTAA